ncbi:Protein ZINC INDUCED FACILITATOR 1 [Lentinula edodes]|uniref:Protein ZINC INDUCED FACILITATOR 1 n=1 Tax=Lentinula edodes TaxID=5353 RepID=A0A1Q3DUQ6_LENED|nr:Protein ZINC INDUCED FACILITATOR 1 [Lentinula edodes]
MTAYRWFPGAQTLTKAGISVPEPAADEVLVKILAAGMCHSDMLYYDNSFEHTKTKPFTMGHEGAGEIIALGESVPSTYPDLHLNQYVVIHARNPCLLSSCPVCSIDADNLCARYFPCGLGIDGSYAPYMVFLQMQFMGVGGLGINAVQIAKNLKRAQTVIAVDLRDEMLQEALEVGADYAVKPEDLGPLLYSHNLNVDTAYDFVGIGPTFKSILEHIRPRGTIIIVGLGATCLELPLVPVTRKEVTIKTSIEETPLITLSRRFFSNALITLISTSGIKSSLPVQEITPEMLNGHELNDEVAPIPTMLPSSTQSLSTPLPVLPMSVLSIAMLGEFLSSNVSVPFLLFMVKGFGFSDEAEAAFWTGVLVSMFFLSQFLTSLLWATLAERYGRRFVLVVTLFGSAVSVTAFGLSKSIGQAICIRLVQGIFAGAVGVARGSVVFITNSSNEGRAYAILGFFWGFGGLLGPIIGGSFERPAERWQVFQHWKILDDFPYLLPSLIAGSILFAGSFLACFLGRDGLSGSIPASRFYHDDNDEPDSRSVVERVVLANENAINSIADLWVAAALNVEGNDDNATEDAVIITHIFILQLNLPPGVGHLVVPQLRGLWMLLLVFINQLVVHPLLDNSHQFSRTLGQPSAMHLNEGETAALLDAGISSPFAPLPWLVITQFGLLALHTTTHDQIFMSYLVRRTWSQCKRFCAIDWVDGVRSDHLPVLFVSKRTILFVPAYLTVVLYRAPFGYPDDHKKSVLMTVLALSTAIRYCGMTFAFTSISVLLNCLTRPEAVGYANGLAQTIVAGYGL